MSASHRDIGGSPALSSKGTDATATREDFVSGEAFTGVRPVAPAHRFDQAALEGWLVANVPGFRGPLNVQQFRGGQSNPTYRLDTPHGRYVLRAKPGPASKLLPSAHAIEREFRVMAALAETEVPVPRMLALCEDESVIGRAFYVMSYVEGRVLWDPRLPEMDPSSRAAHYDELNRVLSALHRLDWQGLGLADFGRHEGYLARQIARWSKQYRASETEPIEAMDRLIDWLPAHLPPGGEETALVHGDYRLDNVIFHPTEPRIVAVLDWELSTLGHPLADFAYHAMIWRLPPGPGRGLVGTDWRSAGIPELQAYVARYCERTGRSGIEHFDFYLAYNLFRMAAILQGIMKRVVEGTAASDHAIEMGRAARPMAELGWEIAQRIDCS
ncbi:MAG: phosphotransferase [Casimicrobiaceae bacterium]|nr:phosphotransferase [Casimicrobiaceae bacterium]MCX8098495.1 phosphotransferase [Casimicrobiaceae bacterium]MDW8311598.1 phosphotransferase [Burkholderiales bacterium]